MDDFGAGFAVALVFVLVAFMIGGVSCEAGKEWATAAAHAEAIRAGVGRWTLDGKSDEKVFVYGAEKGTVSATGDVHAKAR